jgi:hypothetical protein
MLLRRVIDHVKAQNWTAVALDFVIVVVGVFIGIQVSNWNDGLAAAKQKTAYLIAMKEDFQANLSDLRRLEVRCVEDIEAMLLLLREAAKSQPDLTIDELNASFRQIQSMPTFSPITRTYDNLVGSGDFRLIDSRPLLDALAVFERRLGIMALVQGTHEMELVETFQPYIIENMDYAAVHMDRTNGNFPLPPASDPARILLFLKEQEFKNILIQKWTIETDLLVQMRNAISESQAVLNAIDETLGINAATTESGQEAVEGKP